MPRLLSRAVQQLLPLPIQLVTEQRLLTHAARSPLSVLALALEEINHRELPRNVQSSLATAKAAIRELNVVLSDYRQEPARWFSIEPLLRQSTYLFAHRSCPIYLVCKHSSLKKLQLYGSFFYFRELLSILLSNSRRACIESGQSLIVLHVSSSHGTLQLVIQDFGEGMLSVSAKPTHLTDRQAHGIGLPYAQIITQRIFGGSLKVLSWAGLGTQITCTLRPARG